MMLLRPMARVLAPAVVLGAIALVGCTRHQEAPKPTAPAVKPEDAARMMNDPRLSPQARAALQSRTSPPK